MLKLSSVTALGQGMLSLIWEDGYSGIVNMQNTLTRGDAFHFLLDPAAFRTVQLGEHRRSIMWKNAHGQEIDFCADALREIATTQHIPTPSHNDLGVRK